MFHKLASHFTPSLFSRLREGYGLGDFKADVAAGLTVAIVALPLSMAIAIASGVGPERGLYSAIIGGFLVSMLGGSRYQIGGPAGAFIVLVSACVAQIGLDGLILATLMSGLMLMVLGLSRAGALVRHIPHPVVIGFSAGIAVIILASQLKDLLGITLAHDAPELIEKLTLLWQARGTISPAAPLLAAAVMGLIALLRHFAPRAPSLLLAVMGAALAAYAFGLPVETIYDRFGDLPRRLPAPQLPQISIPSLTGALPWAFSFTLLGAIESLLSAVVADQMAGTQHRPSAELVAQGLANMGSAVFGGFCVTGTIARTATNVRAGARSPMSGMLHAIFVLLFLVIAAPLAGFIPMAALAGVLAVVAWNMAEKTAIWHILRDNRAQAAVLIVTFLVVILRDLSEGIALGCALSAVIWGWHRWRAPRPPKSHHA